MNLRLTLLASLVLLPSCISINGNWSSSASTKTTPLTTSSSADGSKVTHKLHGSLSKPKILSTETRAIERARLGVVTRLIEPELAQRTGVEAWRGVWIAEVVSGSAAERAGLREGDVLRAVNGVAVTSPDQLGRMVETTLSPGVAATVDLDRWKSQGGKTWLDRLNVSVTPASHTNVESETETRVLDPSEDYVRLTGLGVAEVSGENATAVWGDPAPRWIVTDVQRGSPAYLAGLRMGDVVTAVDGRAPRASTSLNDALAARILGKKISTAAPNALVVSDTSIAARTDPIGLDVKGPLGLHIADVNVVDDLDDDIEIDIPILLEYESDVTGTSWSFLDFIFQFGANYETKYLRSGTRAPAKVTEWSALPFGLFEYYNSPDRTVWTLLWFIDIETRG